MPISKATATWEGTIAQGKGTMKPAHGTEVPFSLPTRFEGAAGTNPEEMIGAALAGCFSMALSGKLTRGGTPPTKITTTADVHMNKVNDAFTITEIQLDCQASVPGLDAAKFEEIANDTKKTCPVSRALTGTEIKLKASLV